MKRFSKFVANSETNSNELCYLENVFSCFQYKLNVWMFCTHRSSFPLKLSNVIFNHHFDTNHWSVGNSIRNKLNCLFHVCLTKLISKNFELFARFFSFLLPYFPSFLIYPIIHLYYKPNANFIYTFISSSCFFFSFSISSLFRFIVNLILKTFIPWSTVLVLSLFLFRVFFCISFSPVCWPFVHV